MKLWAYPTNGLRKETSMLIIDHGGKEYAKELVLRWLRETGGSNRKLLETATGLPTKITGPLLAELIDEGKVKLDMVIFKLK